MRELPALSEYRSIESLISLRVFRRPIADACDDPTNTASRSSILFAILFAIPTF